jgi:hypothetical protein
VAYVIQYWWWGKERMTVKLSKRLKSGLHDIFHIFVGAYAVMLTMFSVFTPVHAQRLNEPLISPSEVNRRLDDIEKLNLDHRLTITETTLQELVSNFSWYRVTSGGTGLLLMEAVYRHTKKKREEEGGE